MRAEFLKTGNHNLRQMALAEPVGDLNGLIELALAQRAGHGRSELAGLLARAVIGNQTVDHDSDRPGRHEEQQDDHQLGRPSHVVPHAAHVEIDRFL